MHTRFCSNSFVAEYQTYSSTRKQPSLLLSRAVIQFIFVIECFDFNSSGNHVLIGKLQKSVADLEKLHRGKNGANFVIPCRHGCEKAIVEVGQVIQFYDSDRRFPAWGFGGKTPAGTLSHCFNLNGSASFEVEGVEGIMAACATALHNVSLSGPTLFGQVINMAAQIAGHESISYNNGKMESSQICRKLKMLW